MDFGFSIILLNGKYNMLGISKEVLHLFGYPQRLSIFISSERQELLVCMNDEKRQSLSMKYAEETQDFYWFSGCNIFVNKMEKELGILRTFVAIHLEGKFVNHHFFGLCVRFDLSQHSYAVLGHENMPPTIKQRYHRLNHLYNNTFQI